MENKSLKKNLIYNTMYQILSVLTPFITAPYLSRVLGADALGVFSFTNASNSYFVLIAALGTATYGTREISRSRDNKQEYTRLFWEIQIVKLITFTVCILGWLLFSINQKKYTYIYLLLSVNLIATFFDISWFFGGLEAYKLTVMRNCLCKLVGLVLTVVLVKSQDDLLIYIGILSVTTLCSNLSLWAYLPTKLCQIGLFRPRILLHLKQVIVYFIPTIATSVHGILDKSLIGIITDSDAQNGFYLQAEKIINLAKSFVFMSFGTVVGTRISYLFVENKKEEIVSLISKSLKFILIMGVGAACGIIAIAKTFVPVFFGKGYEPVIPLLWCLAPVIFIIGISNCLETHYYIPSGNRSISTRYLLYGACLNIIGNIILIPSFDALGAVFSSLLTEIIVTMLYIRGCRHYVDITRMLLNSWKVFISGIIMLVVVSLLDVLIPIKGLILLISQCLIGVLTYILLLILLNEREILWIIRRIVSRFSVVIRNKKS